MFNQRLAFRHASAITTVSSGLVGMFDDMFGRRPVLLRSMHDPDLEGATAVDLRALEGVSDDDFIVVTIGDNRTGQAFEPALQALLLCSENIKLCMIGHGYEQWEERIRELGLKDRALIVGPVDTRSMVPTVRTASASIILEFGLTQSYQNALPNKLFHGVAASLPLLYSDLPEVVSVAQKYDLGVMINPHDPESIATAITALSKSKEMQDHFRKTAEAAQKDLTWREEEKVFRRVVDTVVKGTKIGAPDFLYTDTERA